MNTRDILALENLDGWRIMQGYMVELKHGLSGNFFAVLAKTEETLTPVVCVDKETLRQIVHRLPERPFKVNTHMLLVHQATGTAFSLNVFDELHLNPPKDGRQTLDIITAKSLANMSGRDHFQWQAGLGYRDNTAGEFVECMRAAFG